jgi:hypothetical protein
MEILGEERDGLAPREGDPGSRLCLRAWLGPGPSRGGGKPGRGPSRGGRDSWLSRVMARVAG